jgi:hypothetical protein
MKKISILLIISHLFLITCSKPTDSEPDPREKAFKGIAVVETENDEFPVAAIHENGDRIAVMTNPSQTKVNGAVFISKNGDKFTVWSENNVPYMAHVSGYTLLFENFEHDKVDVAVISPGGEVEIFREVVVPSSNLFKSFETSSLSKPLSSEELTLYTTLKYAGLALSVAGCVAAIVMSAGIALPCGAAVISVAVELVPENIPALEVSSEAFGIFASAVGCASKDPISCANLVVSTAADVTRAAEIAMENYSNKVDLARGALIAGYGDIQITLTWDNTSDIDLWVTDPNNERIFYNHKRALSGGYLDFDDTNGYGPENVYWQNGTAPAGSYRVQVDYYSGSGTANFEVLVQAFNQVKTYAGYIQPDQTIDVVSFSSDGTLPKLPVNILHARDSFIKSSTKN